MRREMWPRVSRDDMRKRERGVGIAVLQKSGSLGAKIYLFIMDEELERNEQKTRLNLNALAAEYPGLSARPTQRTRRKWTTRNRRTGRIIGARR